jgi:ABC-2 type transport system ATP-binding protein
MCAALAAAGVDYETLADGAIAVTDSDPAQVGAVALRAGVTIFELSRQSAGETLEALFLAATGADQ